MMLETIREFAFGKVEASGEAEQLRRRHAEFLLEFAQRASDELGGSKHLTWVRRLEAERDNLRAALTWSLDAGESETSLLLASALGRLCRFRGGISEGRRWLDVALVSAGEQPPLARSTALQRAASLAHMQEDLQPAQAFAEESLALARSIGDAEGIGRALVILGFVAGSARDYDRCEAALREAVAAFSRSANEREATFTLHMLGYFALARRDYSQARSVIEDALARSRRGGDPIGIVTGTGNLAAVLREEGRIREALPLFRESLLLAHELLDLVRVLENLWDVAAAMASQQDHEGAAVILGGAEALRESIGLGLETAQHETHEVTVSTLRRELDADRLGRCWAEGRAMTPDELVAFTVEWIDSTLLELDGEFQRALG
jgi:tetratricopeptide (TPR) repeat protein